MIFNIVLFEVENLSMIPQYVNPGDMKDFRLEVQTLENFSAERIIFGFDVSCEILVQQKK